MAARRERRIYEQETALEEEKQLEEQLTQLSQFLSDDDAEAEPSELSAEQTDVLRDVSCVIVVDNMPISPKVGKLRMVMNRVFSQIGEIVRLEIPTEEKNGTRKTIGIAILEFATKVAAAEAVKKINGWKLDKKHTFVVQKLEDVQRYLAIPDQYQDPTFAEYQRASPTKITSSENLLTYLTDKFQRDQFVVRFDKETQVHWCENAPTAPELVYDGERQKADNKNWCELYVNWSPRGTYLATFHHPGIALWGGDNWAKLMRFAHTGVEFVTFSPLENFMITWNGQTGTKLKQAIKVFDVKTGVCGRAFPYEHVPENTPWPNFKWSHDDRYFARLDRQKNNDLICVYETPSMKLLDQKSHRVNGIMSFSWSPSDNIMAFWTPEDGNTPARVTLLEWPSRQILTQKNLFNVVDCKMHWHPDGHFLCVQITRHSKTKKKTFTAFEIFRMRDKDYPCENMEMKDRVDDFAWEKNDGVRFGIVHSENETRADVSFYTMTALKNGEKMDLLHTHKDRDCDKLYWSTMGNYIVIAGQKSPHNGKLEFYDVDAEASLGQHEHFMCTSIEWDPSGRICASVVSQSLYGTRSMRHQLESGYRLWSFQGTPLHQVQLQDFYQFEWRPRPKSLLTDKQVEEVISPANMKAKKEKFRQIDKLLRNNREASEARKMIKMRDDFRNVLLKRKEKLDQAARVALLGYDPEAPSRYTVVMEDYSEVIEMREDVQTD